MNDGSLQNWFAKLWNEKCHVNIQEYFFHGERFSDCQITMCHFVPTCYLHTKLFYIFAQKYRLTIKWWFEIKYIHIKWDIDVRSYALEGWSWQIGSWHWTNTTTRRWGAATCSWRFTGAGAQCVQSWETRWINHSLLLLCWLRWILRLAWFPLLLLETKRRHFSKFSI